MVILKVSWCCIVYLEGVLLLRLLGDGGLLVERPDARLPGPEI